MSSRPKPSLTLENYEEVLKSTPNCMWLELTQDIIKKYRKYLDLEALSEIGENALAYRMKSYIELGHTKKEAYTLAVYGRIIPEEELFTLSQ